MTTLTTAAPGRMAAKGQRFTRAAADEDFANPLATVD